MRWVRYEPREKWKVFVMLTKRSALLVLIMVIALIIPTAALAGNKKGGGTANAAGAEISEVTLLHTNDFHGRLETDYKGRGGSAYMASIINDIRSSVGDENVALLDAGDVYFAAPAISQLLMGESTIDIYNMMGYDLAAFGNHEFDKGQLELADRVAQSDFPWLGANVVLDGTDWDLPAWAEPYEILEMGEGANAVKLGVLGLAGEETPEVTLIGTTAGLVFKDLTETILHYYDEVLEQADAMVVLVHMGTDDSGPYDGLVTVAQNMIDAGKPLDLMIGGHQHQALFDPVEVGDTTIVSAGYYGRWVGQLDLTIDKAAQRATIDRYQLITVSSNPTAVHLISEIEWQLENGGITSAGVANSLVKKSEGVQKALDKGNTKAAENKLRALENQIVAQTGNKISDSAAQALLLSAGRVMAEPDPAVEEQVAYWAEIVAPIVNVEVAKTNIDLVRNYNDESNMGDIVTDSMLWSADLYDDGEVNGSVDVAFTNPGGLRENILIPDGASLPYPVTWGDTFDVLPFGNTLFLMDLTGAQIQDLLDQSATLYKGILQTSGSSYYWYNETDDLGVPTAWGAYGVEVGGEPLVRDEVYRVVTNDFLAGGQDGWTTFADGTERWNTYYDMQEGFVEYIKGLDDGVIDADDIPMDRIVRLDDVVTMMHVNDTHGRWTADYYGGGMVYLASLIEAERDHNPDALLFDAGDTFQGNSFAYFFKDRPDNPIAGGMNLLEFDAMTVGNHEFNFGPTTFASMLGQVNAPLLGTANMDDDGSYGFINGNLEDYINLDVNGKKVTVFGLTNPRIYRYELPTNIPGMTFYPALDTAEVLVPDLVANEAPDLLVGLTHVGYQPYGGEIDSDELIAQNVDGIDVLIGGHSHTTLNPAVMVSDMDNNPDGTLIAHARRYAGYLGQVNVGFIGDEIVLREGFLIPTSEATVDPALEAYLAPFDAEIVAYNETVIGDTAVPIDALEAYTEETNGANLQADAAIFELASNETPADIHLSGAMSNRLVAAGATPAVPLDLTKGDMFTLMPYENSLVVMSMSGPQIKEVLERGYRNYYNFKYVPGYGGYSHYTTCMLTTNEGVQITYDEKSGAAPDGDNVVSLTINGTAVDFASADTYNVSSVNYVVAGSCNFNDGGVTLWPLDQIVADTQLYVRDSVINYVAAQAGTISPAIDGRLVFTNP
jgi:2',3'-cyclic-nucleotide 2'-phosphodiesterase (5'-nucleotidase family)